MQSLRLLLQWLLWLGLSVVPQIGQAQTTASAVYAVYLDSDLNSTTGCTVPGPGGASMPGVDLRIEADAGGSPPRVLQLRRAACTGATFGPASTVPANYPLGLNVGINGADVVELALPPGMLSLGSSFRVGFGARTDGGSVDVLFTTNGTLGGPPIVFGVPARSIPLLAPWQLVLLSGLLAGVALWTMHRHPHGARLILLCSGLGLAYSAYAANFQADGQVSDWAGTAPQGIDPVGDSVPPQTASDLVAGFIAREAGAYYFRLDVVDVESPGPLAAPDAYSTPEDTALNVPAPGVLVNDSDPAGDPLTAQLVNGPSRGSLTLNPDGSFSYTPNADVNGADSFTYRAASPDATSAPATVSLSVTAVNDAPVNSVPGPQITDSVTPLVFSTANGNAISLTDVDAGSGLLQLSLSMGAVGNGTLSLANPGGVLASLSGNGTETVLATGSLVNLNLALNGPAGSLTYTPVGSSAARTLTVISNDQGNTGSGGPQSGSDSVLISSDAPPTVTASVGSGTFANDVALVLTFSEPVNVSATPAPGITLNCGGNVPLTNTTGSNLATLTLGYTAPLPSGSCTLNVPAANVTDVDTIDPPDNMVVDSSFTFAVDAAPVFVSSVPATDGAVVTTTPVVSFTFDEDVDNLGSAITLNCGAAVTGAISGSGTPTLTFTPTNPLTQGASCTATAVAAQIGDSDSADPPQNPAANVVRAFSIDAAPNISSANPADGTPNFSVDGNLSVQFSEPVILTAAAFSLQCPLGSAVAFALSGSGSSTVTLDPNAALPVDTACRLTIDMAQVSDVDAIDPPDVGSGVTTVNFTTAELSPVANDDVRPITPHLINSSALGAPLLTANDVIGAGQITSFGFASSCTGTAPGSELDAGTSNGRLTVNADGGYTYLPPVGVSNATRSFCYTVTGGDTANLLFSIANDELTWFVDQDAAAGGDGTQARPFRALQEVEAVDTPNDNIYWFAAASFYSNNSITLEAGQRVIGEGANAPVSTLTGIIPVAGSAFPVPTGTPPTNITGVFTYVLSLSTNNLVNGVAFGVPPTGGGTTGGIRGTNFGTLTVGAIDFSVSNAILLENGTVNGEMRAFQGRMTLTNVGGDLIVNSGPGGQEGLSLLVSSMPAAASLVFRDGFANGGRIALRNNSPAATINVGAIRVDFLLVENSPITITGATSELFEDSLGALSSAQLTLDNAVLVGGATFASVVVNTPNTTSSKIILNNVTGDLNINGGSLSGGGAGLPDLSVSGNVDNVLYAGSISKTTAGALAAITGPGTGNVTLSGNLSCTGTCGTGSSGLVVNGRTGGTLNFSGTSKVFNTGAANAVNLSSNAGATIAFPGGGLDIDTTTGAGFSAIGGGTLSVGGAGNTVTSTTGRAVDVADTTIAATGLNFQSISSNGAPNGIRIAATGTLGGLTVAGTGTPGSGGTIQNSTGVGIVLDNTSSPSFNNMLIDNTVGHGIEGTRVHNFTLTNSQIEDSTADGDAATQESNIGFNQTAIPTQPNVTGVVTITGNTLLRAQFHGIGIEQYVGDLADVTISNNTVTSATTTAASFGDGIRLISLATASTIANVARATISANSVSNFPSASGIRVQGGNVEAANLTVPTLGIAGSATDIVSITGNRLSGQSVANPMDVGAIFFVRGRGEGNFNISNNGTVANPLSNINDSVIAIGASGTANVTGTVNNNVINNGDGTEGIAFGTSSTPGSANTPQLTITVDNNNVAAGGGISGSAINASGTLRARIRNNTVATPAIFGLAGIRIRSGSAASGDESVCINLSGNTSAGNGGASGIGLFKQGSVATTNDFAVNGMAATATPAVETYVAGLNPAGGGVSLLSATSGFSNCNLP